MTLRRIALAAAVAVAGLALTACEKPAPGVSVFSGTTTEHRAALCWSFSGETLQPEQCAQDLVQRALDGDGVASVPTLANQTVGISVDPTVADTGWFPILGSQRLTEEPVRSTYFRFTFPAVQVPADGVPLQIVAGDGQTTRGIWIFRLVPTPSIG
jgi:hypothetical protein